MTITLAFDVYGTLIDTHGLVKQLGVLVGDKAQEFSNSWREKQLEYSFRRALMKSYLPFFECTRSALEYACKLHQVDLSTEQKSELLALYSELPAFSDTLSGLSALDRNQFNPYAFSNGTEVAVRKLLQASDTEQYLLDVVSVDDLQTFKPDPAVYDYFLQRSAATKEQTWLISSNPFDVIGALNFGMQAAWLKRSGAALFDDWELSPTLVVNSLENIGEQILEKSASVSFHSGLPKCQIS
ncbi:MAG: haloacid dehalogenase type II [Oceanospirillaceae bacterium]|nr:haloacid dehalogenase type II [Oceanospirillaceae bacterium]